MEINHLEVPSQEKEAGNKYWKEQNYENASKSYSKALLAFNYIIKEQKFTSEEQAISMINEIQLPCLLNLSACYLKLGFGYSNVVVHCTDALKIDQNNVKALYRRAIALTLLDQFKEARADIDKAIELDPNNKSLNKILADLNKRQNDYKVKTKRKDKVT